MVKTKLKDIKTEEQSKKISNLKKESVMPVVKTDIKIAKPGMKELVNIDKLEINNLPEGVKVATMCCSCFLGSKLYLDNIEKYMVLNENDILTVIMLSSGSISFNSKRNSFQFYYFIFYLMIIMI